MLQASAIIYRSLLYIIAHGDGKRMDTYLPPPPPPPPHPATSESSPNY